MEWWVEMELNTMSLLCPLLIEFPFFRFHRYFGFYIDSFFVRSLLTFRSIESCTAILRGGFFFFKVIIFVLFPFFLYDNLNRCVWYSFGHQLFQWPSSTVRKQKKNWMFHITLEIFSASPVHAIDFIRFSFLFDFHRFSFSFLYFFVHLCIACDASMAFGS